MYSITNPATGKTIKTFKSATDEQVNQAVRRAAAAFTSWRDTSIDKRCEALSRVADAMLSERDELARIITVEMGKPITAARGEVETSASIVRYYAENAAQGLAPQLLAEIEECEAFIERQPIGVILGIMPWNFPYYQVARFAGPVLAAGNTLLLKHSSQCPASALAMERIFAAELPVDAYVNIFASNEQIAAIVAHPEIQGVSLTGSERAGAAVGAAAGSALKKVVLELGGSDPFIVLDEHKLDEVAATAVASRLNNSGQACAAPKRFIIVDEVFDQFAEAFVAGMEAVAPGDPSDPGTVLGPLVSEAALKSLHEQVTDTVAQGATLLTGGHRVGDTGAFYAPTVLADVGPGMRAYDEELFGPASVLYRVADADAAVALANDSSFGLGSTVFAGDESLARSVANRLEVGMVAVNGRKPNVPALPFGGVKRSGFGRELGTLGLEEFLNRKVVTAFERE